MNRNENRPTGKLDPTTKSIPWRRALLGGLASLSLAAAVACSTTTDSGDTSQPTHPTVAPAASATVTATNQPATLDADAATDTPNAGFLNTGASDLASAKLALPGEASGVPTPTVRFAPTPTRVPLPTVTPFVLATRSLFATSTPLPQIRATLIRPTANMEDVLDLYAEPYDPQRPVVCFDETSTPVVGGDPARSAAPGRDFRCGRNYEYRREGTRNLFLACEPLAGWREVAVTERRTMQDFARRMRWLADEAYPEAEVVRVVLDNLNTHRRASLYETFPG